MAKMGKNSNLEKLQTSFVSVEDAMRLTGLTKTETLNMVYLFPNLAAKCASRKDKNGVYVLSTYNAVDFHNALVSKKLKSELNLLNTQEVYNFLLNSEVLPEDSKTMFGYVGRLLSDAEDIGLKSETINTSIFKSKSKDGKRISRFKLYRKTENLLKVLTKIIANSPKYGKNKEKAIVSKNVPATTIEALDVDLQTLYDAFKSHIDTHNLRSNAMAKSIVSLKNEINNLYGEVASLKKEIKERDSKVVSNNSSSEKATPVNSENYNDPKYRNGNSNLNN